MAALDTARHIAQWFMAACDQVDINLQTVPDHTARLFHALIAVNCVAYGNSMDQLVIIADALILCLGKGALNIIICDLLTGNFDIYAQALRMRMNTRHIDHDFT